MSMYHIDGEGLQNYLEGNGLVSPNEIYIVPDGLSIGDFWRRRVCISNGSVVEISEALLNGQLLGEPQRLGDYMNPKQWPYILADWMGKITGYTPHSQILNEGFSLIEEPDVVETKELVFSTLLAHEIGHLQREQLAGYFSTIAGIALTNILSLPSIIERPETAPKVLLATTILSIASYVIGRAILELQAINFSRDHVEGLTNFVHLDDAQF